MDRMACGPGVRGRYSVVTVPSTSVVARHEPPCGLVDSVAPRWGARPRRGASTDEARPLFLLEVEPLAIRWLAYLSELLAYYPDEMDAIFAAVRADEAVHREQRPATTEEEAYLAYVHVLYDRRAEERSANLGLQSPFDPSAQWPEVAHGQ